MSYLYTSPPRLIGNAVSFSGRRPIPKETIKAIQDEFKKIYLSQSSPPTQPLILTYNEIAEHLGVNPSTVAKYAKKLNIPVPKGRKKEHVLKETVETVQDPIRKFD